jgi:hypothetical protein
MSDVKEQAKAIETSVFLQNVVKLIPVEIIAIYAVINGLIPATAGSVAVWVVLGVLMLLVPFYVIFAIKVKRVDQIILMTIAFPIWIGAMGGFPEMASIVWYEPWMLSVALALFTLIPPMFVGQRVSVEEIEEKFPQEGTASRAIEKKSWREV